ncbi:MAG: hypothetical protein HGA72_10840 [Chlorobiaceae bacterium]|nr:hypothetical protein [Chlorobiaceae bacterium]
MATDLPKHIRLLPISAQSPHDLPAEQPAFSRTDQRAASLRSDEEITGICFLRSSQAGIALKKYLFG